MIKRNRDESNIVTRKKKASTAFDFNDIVFLNSSGYLAKATASTVAADVEGLIQRNVDSTSKDYAKNSTVPVERALSGVEFEMDVGNGTASQADVGSDYDLLDEKSIDLATSAVGQVRVNRVLSSTKVIGEFNV